MVYRERLRASSRTVSLADSADTSLGFQHPPVVTRENIVLVEPVACLAAPVQVVVTSIVSIEVICGERGLADGTLLLDWDYVVVGCPLSFAARLGRLGSTGLALVMQAVHLAPGLVELIQRLDLLACRACLEISHRAHCGFRSPAPGVSTVTPVYQTGCRWGTLGAMTRGNRISVRAGASHDQVKAMAEALSTQEAAVSTSDVYRTLLSEAMRSRMLGCSRGHVGPIRSQACGHCGRPS